MGVKPEPDGGRRANAPRLRVLSPSRVEFVPARGHPHVLRFPVAQGAHHPRPRLRPGRSLLRHLFLEASPIALGVLLEGGRVL